MIRIGLAAGIAVVAMAAGCGGGGSNPSANSTPTAPAAVVATTTQSPPPTVDRESVDTSINYVIRGVRVLAKLHGSLYDILAQYQEAEADLKASISTLNPTPDGVPSVKARAARTDLQVLASSLDAVRQCFQNEAGSFGGDNCAGASKAVNKDATRAGQAIRVLVPYGSRSLSDVLAKIDAAAKS